MYNALRSVPILLPSDGVDLSRWAVIACDQFTSQPRYWEKVQRLVGCAPSTLQLILPEVWLSETDARIPQIHSAMSTYLDENILHKAVEGAILVERETVSGRRIGLVAALDLEAYDYSEGSSSIIRPTEQTVPARVPPRARIRMGAPLELPHVMMLIDDPCATVIEPLYAQRANHRMLYDFELMLDGGHLRGWGIENEAFEQADAALQALAEGCNGLLYAVGDGNHSLAAARQCWLEIRDTLNETQRQNHPARWALVELVNLHCPALKFEPIHRLLIHADMEALLDDLEKAMAEEHIDVAVGDDAVFFQGDAQRGYHFDAYPLPFLQAFLDQWIERHPSVEIDYIHDEEALCELVKGQKDAVGLKIRGFDKQELFPTIRRHGRLPRKAFSMGISTEKRYYLESRSISV